MHILSMHCVTCSKAKIAQHYLFSCSKMKCGREDWTKIEKKKKIKTFNVMTKKFDVVYCALKCICVYFETD